MQSKFYGNGAIYSMTITSEAIARELADTLRAKPVQAYEIPRLTADNDGVPF